MNDDAVVFSDKIQPLFDLLTCWDDLAALKKIKKRTVKQQQEFEYLTKLSKVTTVLFSGGRDSSKTFSLSCWNVIAAADYGHRILYTRQTMSSTDNSITQALDDRIELLGFGEEFDFANNNYTLKDGSCGKISITGQRTSVGTQTAKLKSLENYSVFETDEGEELTSYEEWVKIKRSMRAKDVQCLSIITFNPPTREHWIATEFYEDVPDGFNGIIGDILYIHTTYLDNGKENMAEHNWREYEELREHYELYLSTPKDERDKLSKTTIKKYQKYRYEILGGFKKQADGVVYDDWEIGEFDESLGYVHGLDFGVSDPDACVKVAVDRSEMKIYVKENFFQNNLSTGQLEEMLETFVGKSDIIIADSSAKRSIRDLWDKGFEIERCRKGPDSVKNGIKTIKSYTIVASPCSKNVHKALNNYKWTSKKGEIPDHDWSDLMDAMRYAVIYLLEGSSGGVI